MILLASYTQVVWMVYRLLVEFFVLNHPIHCCQNEKLIPLSQLITLTAESRKNRPIYPCPIFLPCERKLCQYTSSNGIERQQRVPILQTDCMGDLWNGTAVHLAWWGRPQTHLESNWHLRRSNLKTINVPGVSCRSTRPFLTALY